MSKKKSRPINRATENQANKNHHDRLKPTALRANQEIVFRDELAILLDEYKGHLSIMPAQPREGQNPKYFIGVVAQDESFILNEMIKRLASKGLHPTRWQIKDYLNAVSDVMRSKLAWGEEASALPFLNKNYYQPKKRGRKPLEKKRGKRRPVKVNGVQYESIAEADRQTHLGYFYIQEASLKNNAL